MGTKAFKRKRVGPVRSYTVIRPPPLADGDDDNASISLSEYLGELDQHSYTTPLSVSTAAAGDSASMPSRPAPTATPVKE